MIPALDPAFAPLHNEPREWPWWQTSSRSCHTALTLSPPCDRPTPGADEWMGR